MWRRNLVVVLFLILHSISLVLSFVPVSKQRLQRQQYPSIGLVFLSSKNNDDDNDMIRNNQFSSASRSQEKMLEALSRNGAEKIASLSIQERARRAMLAEAIEDEIFANTERLESLFDRDGTLPIHHREKAVSIAKKTKSLQIQYGELVSGGESSVLNSVQNAFLKDENGNQQ